MGKSAKCEGTSILPRTSVVHVGEMKRIADKALSIATTSGIEGDCCKLCSAAGLAITHEF